MVTTLSHISEHQSQLLQDAISEIVKTVDPEKIICYGTRANINEVWSCFIRADQSRTCMHFDFLIITREGRKEKEHEVFDKISKCEKETMHITAVVHSISAVNEALEKGMAFFTNVYDKGVIVYDSGNTPLISPELNKLTKEDLIENRKRYWNKWFCLAKRFYETACNCVANDRNDVAVFMLHQAVELTCIAALRTCIGYRPSTHNLKRLFFLIENFTLNMRLVFPRSTNEEAELFNILYRAYSDVRYKEEYSISANTVFVLTQRVKELLVITENLYHDKLNEITKDRDNEKANYS